VLRGRLASTREILRTMQIMPIGACPCSRHHSQLRLIVFLFSFFVLLHRPFCTTTTSCGRHHRRLRLNFFAFSPSRWLTPPPPPAAAITPCQNCCSATRAAALTVCCCDDVAVACDASCVVSTGKLLLVACLSLSLSLSLLSLMW